jgi:hypothetical protein
MMQRHAPYSYEDDEEIQQQRQQAATPPIRRRSATTREEVAAQSRRKPRQRQGGAGAHPVLWLGLGMCAMLVLWFIGVHVYAWSMNTVSDPGYYTQTEHRDAVTVKDAQGHQYRVQAFMNPQNHISLLVMPVSDPGDSASKDRIITGPALVNFHDLEHVTLTATAHGTAIMVVVQGPVQVDVLAAIRQSTAWTTDLNGQQPHP